jgi:hypothetical protein
VNVENIKYTAGAPWSGTLVDTWVDIDGSSTMMSAVVSAITAGGYAAPTGADSGYISEINGLTAGSAGGYDGWMTTLNDWFINESMSDFSVESGDEINVFYSLDMGEDYGGSWANNDKTLSAVAFSMGTLDAAFDKDTHAYTLSLPVGTASLTVTPTASNKNFQVHTYLGTQESGTAYKRTEAIPSATET